MLRKNRSDTHEMRQNRRLALAVAIADMFQDYIGDENEFPEPYLENAEDEKSDLILELNFGHELNGEARLPYEGGVRISDNEKLKRLFFYFREHFEKLFREIQFDPSGVIMEEF